MLSSADVAVFENFKEAKNPAFYLKTSYFYNNIYEKLCDLS